VPSLAGGTLPHSMACAVEGVRTQGGAQWVLGEYSGYSAPCHPASHLTLAVCLFVHCVFVCDATDSSRRCAVGGDPLCSGADVRWGGAPLPKRLVGFGEAIYI
jgi:hypothetical protein